MDNEAPAIIVKDLYKTFRLPHEQHNGIKQSLINVFKGNRGYTTQKVLDGISFEIKKGEFFGIVGRNGSGKSTLLKLLAGIYSPDKGVIHVNGSLTPFIELGVGFNHELTGRENVFMNGALLGFDRAAMEAMYDDIVDFAELGEFMDQKLKNYSSGMQVRLAFSIAIRAQTDILIMDEVLAVGDAAFQKKCLDVFRDLKSKGVTIILVTHDMGSVEKFCDRVLLLNKGSIMNITDPHTAATEYARLNIKEDKNEINESNEKAKKRWGVGGIKVKSILLGHGGQKTSIFNFGDDLEMTVSLSRDIDHAQTPMVCGVAIYNQDGLNLIGPNTLSSPETRTKDSFTMRIKSINFAPGEYSMTVAIYDIGVTEPYDYLDKSVHFSVISDHTVHGLYEIPVSWK